ncbi:MAG: Zn-dependent hydrolase [Candidatus Chaera renei]|uniref:Zn-dependent hydrolase n=1 Tax=Candidatus Chaera renei TaxID=2506947 RepID=A0A4Q0AIU2_9BACT|nr:MAG: Zn-dependent hydrolase [Candidatus Chaera renei]
MDIEYKGANCLRISTKRHVIVVDTRLSLDGMEDYKDKSATVQLSTQRALASPFYGNILTLDMPGEYEADGLVVRGVAATRHIDKPSDPKQATIFRMTAAGISLVVVGHVAPDLTEDQLETIGSADILIIPVGGGGYTLDAHEAVKITRQIDPKIVIPTHYTDKGINYEVPQSGLDPFLSELGAPQESLTRLKLKSVPSEEALKVCILERSR